MRIIFCSILTLLFTMTLLSQKMTKTELYGYGQFYHYTEKTPAIVSNGGTAGMYVLLDWNDMDLQLEKQTIAFGTKTEFMAGFGSVNSSFAFDLIADIFGIAGQYQIDTHNSAGIFYEPIELVATPFSSFVGSKMEMKYCYNNIQVAVSRGGNGFVYGCIVPKDASVMHTVAVQYLMKETMVGIKYSDIAFDRKSGSGIMLFFGFYE